MMAESILIQHHQHFSQDICHRIHPAYAACFTEKPLSAEALWHMCCSAPSVWLTIGDVDGFLLYRTLPDAVELLSIGVLPARRGQGLASQLLSQATYAWDQAALPCFLEVRTSSHTAITLYEKHGFISIHQRKNYYPPQANSQIREDALMMQREPLQLR